MIRRLEVIAPWKVLELTLAQYGYFSTYYEVLKQENYLFDAELAELTTLQQKINEMVFLYKTLRVGW